MAGPGTGTGNNLDSRAVSSLDLEPYFVSNQSGEANAGGVVTFYKDSGARTDPKFVYQLSQDPATGVYSYVALPNPMTLSGVGTFQNAGGDNIAVYYFPFDEFGNEELYYITVYDAFGNLQFTREAWPYPFGAAGGGTIASAAGVSNQLSNPQFAKINFISPLSLSFVGAQNLTIPIAPDWDLEFVSTGNSTLLITRNAIQGSSAFPFNPPFTLQVEYGANVTSCKLIQTLRNNPDWAAPTVAGEAGFLAGSIMLGVATSASMQYVTSGGVSKTILNETNNTGARLQYNETVQLDLAANAATGLTGFDQIVINLVSTTSEVTNIQAVPLTTNVSGVLYDQTPVNRQVDHLFNYYNDQLQFKPIPSYLDAWDFPTNPSQILGATVAASAIGANKSKYVWDQTIIFQSADSGVGITRSADGAIVLTAAATTQTAMIQYQPQIIARKMLFDKMSVHMVLATAAVQDITVSLWYTSDVSLPSAFVSNNSIVLTLDVSGTVATNNGTWTQVQRSNLGDATVTTLASANYQTFMLNGWDMKGSADISTATFFAVVVSTNEVTIANAVAFKSVSVCPGDIATIPAPQSQSAVLAACQRYYEKSFDVTNVAQQAAGVNTGAFVTGQILGSGVATQQFPTTVYKVAKHAVPNLVTTYSPVAASAQAYNLTSGLTCTATTVVSSRENGFYVTYVAGGGITFAGDTNAVHWSSNALLGY